jgi:MFS family permease
MEKPANRWAILQIINLGTFMTTLDVGIVNLALPVMASDNEVTLATVQWVVTIYLLVMAGLLPVLGNVSDRLNRGKIYSAGFLVFALGSLLAALPGGFALLLAARAVQGCGAAMIMANSQAMVRFMFPDKERGKALGINTIVMSAGTLSGPTIGGFMMNVWGWPSLFWTNVPIGLIAAAFGYLWFPETERSRRPVDFVGSLALAVCVLCLFTAAVFFERTGVPGMAVVPAGAGLLSAGFLAFYERGRPNGVIDPILYRVRPIAVGNLSAFLYYAVQTAAQIPQAFYMRSGLGLPIPVIGLVLAVQPVFLGLLGPLSGWSRDRYGAFWPTSLGSVLCTLSTVPVIAGGAPVTADFIWAGALFGAGGGLFLASNNADIMSAAPGDKSSLVGSMLALIRYLGMIAGIALAVLLVGHLDGEQGSASGGAAADPVPHLRLLFCLCGLLSLAMLAAALLRPIRKQVKPVSQSRHASGN